LSRKRLDQRASPPGKRNRFGQQFLIPAFAAMTGIFGQRETTQGASYLKAAILNDRRHYHPLPSFGGRQGTLNRESYASAWVRTTELRKKPAR